MSMIPFRAQRPSTVMIPTMEPSEMTRSEREGRQHGADQRRREGEKDQAGQPPVSEGPLEDEEDPDHDRDRDHAKFFQRSLACCIFSQQLRIVPDRELDFPEPALDFFDHRAEIASL